MGAEKPRWVENSIMHLALETTHNILGQGGYYAVMRVAKLEHYLEALLNGMFTMYSEPVARGLFRRWGRQFGLAAVEHRMSAHVLKPLLGLRPPQHRVHTLLNAILREANAARGEPLHILQIEENAYWLTFQDCLYCRQLQATEPACYAVVGMIEAVLHWGTGQEFFVREIECMALGAAACRFKIPRQIRHD